MVKLRDEEPDADKLGLRLALASAPGEDFRYDLSFDEYLTAAFTDEVRTHDGLKVIVPGNDLELLRGATLDYNDNQGLVIRNPNRPAAPTVEGLTSDDALSAEIEAMITGEVNPALAAHGGFVSYVGHDGEGTAYLTMGGGMPRVFDEQDDDARRCPDDAQRSHRRGPARQGPHRPRDRREPLLQLTSAPSAVRGIAGRDDGEA